MATLMATSDRFRTIAATTGVEAFLSRSRIRTDNGGEGAATLGQLKMRAARREWLEPRLLRLYREIRAVKDDKRKPVFCANMRWYRAMRSLKPQSS